jgi:hypothetical protein
MNTSNEPHKSLEDFDPGEWDRLLAEAEAGGESLDGEQVLTELRDLRSRGVDERGRKSN